MSEGFNSSMDRFYRSLTLTHLVSKLVTREAQDHQPMGVLALQLIKLAEVPGGGASERRHILYEDHTSPKDVEVHRVPFYRGGPQVIEGLSNERHLCYGDVSLEGDCVSACDCI